jgi:ATP-citrate lyase alpha-subunit
MSNVFSLHDSIGVYGDQKDAIQSMLDYDYLCKKKSPSVCCIINPTMNSGFERCFWGSEEIFIPFFPTITEALKEIPFTILINFASERSAYPITLEAIESKSVEKIVVVAEGVSEKDIKVLKALADKNKKLVIGPATTGGFVAGIVKLGNAGGTIENIIENKLYIRGNVGIVTKSGGIFNELMTIVSKNTNGVCEAIAIGGDRYPMSTLAEQIQRFELNKDIKLILVLGEVGGEQEYEVAKLKKEGKISKPIIGWISGTSGAVFRESLQFGHAGAMANSENETTQNKLKAFTDSGIIVPSSFDQLEETIKEEAKKIGIDNMPDVVLDDDVLTTFTSFEHLIKNGKIRYERNFISSISKKHDNEETYVGRDIAQTAKTKSIGYIIGLLWFKKEFNDDICELFELMIKLLADHGPLVATAHNTIVATRAGKDMVSSVVSGLLTIGPRHGGAINDAAYYFNWGIENALSPFEFVNELKKKTIPIPGIGHRVKSKTNPDKRVAMLVSKTNQSLKQHKYLDYALQIEQITVRKKDSLILNVDGAIAAILLDVLSEKFTDEEIKNLIDYEAFNAFFVLARSIGLLGHFIDQRRLNQGLYRVPEWDITEID